jgi:RNA polymerase sigma factor (sigma-70 family)
LFGFSLGGSYRTKTVINDTELLRQYFEHHSEEAFAALVQRYLSLVYFAALRRTNGDAHLAEDVAQQVFAALAADAASLRRHAVLTGWLYVATRHAAANAMRAEQRRFNREQEVHAMQENQTTPDLEADWNQLRPQLDGAIDELNEPDRLAVLLRYFENRPYAEIGATLRVTENAARVRVDRALGKLRVLLVRRGITSTAAALGLALSSQSALAAPPALAASVTGFALTSSAAAGAAGVGGATAITGILQFMSTTKTIITTASVLAALAVGTAVYEVRETSQAETALATATKENAALRERVQREAARTAEVEKKFRSAEALAASLQKSADEIEAAKKTAEQLKQTAPAKAGANPAGNFFVDVVMTNPEYQELNAKHNHSSLRFTYGPLYRKLGLSPEQIANFEAAMDEQEQSTMDAFLAARSQEVSYEDPSLAQLKAADAKPVDDKLRATLGDAGFEEFNAYKKTMDSRAAVDSLASALYYTETPLTAGQADQLTQLVAANTGKRSVDAAGTTTFGEVDWDKVYAQAQGILSSSQLNLLQAVGEKKRTEDKLAALSGKLINEVMANSNKTSGN